ncbi:MAG: M23 family metallopeptidase, partial [Proteobacteria bacterium]|nr:M23 family metallopeptidase [Pseudomonadota bacterium]
MAGKIHENGLALLEAAKKLGVKVVYLAGIISRETGGTMNPNLRGGSGNRHVGLIQFDPENQRKYGITSGMSFEKQLMGPVIQYLRDRFRDAGIPIEKATPAQLYASILAGNPKYINSSDGNGSAAQAVPTLRAKGREILSQYGIKEFDQNDNVVPPDMVASQDSRKATAWLPLGGQRLKIVSFQNAPLKGLLMHDRYGRPVYDEERNLRRHEHDDVGLFIPKGFNPDQPFYKLYYAHGWDGSLPDTVFRQMVAAQAQELQDQGHNLVVIMPQGPVERNEKEPGRFDEGPKHPENEGFFARFDAEASRHLAAMLPGDAEANAKKIETALWVGAAYSGGYAMIAAMRKASKANGKQLAGIALIDALYNPDGFASYSKERDARFVSYYTPSTREYNEQLRGEIAEEFPSKLAEEGEPLNDKKNAAIHFIAGQQHEDMVEKTLVRAVAQLNLPGRLTPPPANVAALTRKPEPGPPAKLETVTFKGDDDYVFPLPAGAAKWIGRGWEQKHKGQDVPAEAGTFILAPKGGILEQAGDNGDGYGNAVRIRMKKHTVLIGHMSKFGPGIVVGIPVEQGQILGHVGHTGYTDGGDHIHVEAFDNETGARVNPYVALYGPDQSKWPPRGTSYTGRLAYVKNAYTVAQAQIITAQANDPATFIPRLVKATGFDAEEFAKTHQWNLASAAERRNLPQPVKGRVAGYQRVLAALKIDVGRADDDAGPQTGRGGEQLNKKYPGLNPLQLAQALLGQKPETLVAAADPPLEKKLEEPPPRAVVAQAVPAPAPPLPAEPAPQPPPPAPAAVATPEPPPVVAAASPPPPAPALPVAVEPLPKQTASTWGSGGPIQKRVSPPGLREGRRSGLIKSDAPAPPAENKPWNWRNLLPSWNKTPAPAIQPDIKMAKTKPVLVGEAQPLPEPLPQTNTVVAERKVKIIPIGKAAALQKGTQPGEPQLVGKLTPLHTGRLAYASPSPAA